MNNYVDEISYLDGKIIFGWNFEKIALDENYLG